MKSEDDIGELAWIQQLLDDPQYADNPLKPALEVAQKHAKYNQTKLKRLLSISDSYFELRSQSLIEDYKKQSKQFEKISRISDNFQDHVRLLNEDLKYFALHDPLTQLPNRRMFFSRLREEEARSRRTDHQFCLAILDLDHFKQINDQFGHDIGDNVLRDTASAINNSLRDYDLCARWGGEEFIVLLPDTYLAMALNALQRMKSAIHHNNIANSDIAVSLTASVGLTIFRPNENHTDTIKRADDALLAAKRAGRNRIEIL